MIDIGTDTTSVGDNIDLVVVFCRQNHEDWLADELEGK